MMLDAQTMVTDLVEDLLRIQPEANYQIQVNSELAKAVGWAEGQLLTKYNIPVVFNDTIFIGGNSSDIWVVDPQNVV